MCTERTEAGRRQAGITLIELIIFIVIVGVGIAGILAVMNVTVRSSADPVVHKQMAALAEAILEEVMTREYAPNGTYPQPPGCPVRNQADDVQDYANCNGANFIGGDATLGATSIAALAPFQARVAVAAPAALTGVDMRSITVTVTGPGGRSFELTARMADY